MAPDSQGIDDKEPTTPTRSRRRSKDTASESNNGTDEGEEEDEDEEDEEPRLKYAALTKGQGTLYRNGDAVSAFLVAGDKMVGCIACVDRIHG